MHSIQDNKHDLEARDEVVVVGIIFQNLRESGRHKQRVYVVAGKGEYR
jgi:hypothetical protein